MSRKLLDINASWTAREPVQGWVHFRISGRRRPSKSLLEVELMAVCDRSVRFWLAADCLTDRENWLPGWR
ncbi:TIGR02450 family Trp-rich protein [Pseudobacteriovorax antillogorgiicola]|uniref:TIGR02450 family Trp-rich protein n=1 Tax=Pseudobacteriovorax antillogorgiicola TaxID=1513793 RepID=UPI00104902C8|nr:TIGR02450 family Trp-rich protein [Pseudobacteriovorax antillogorgiicola]